MHLRCENCEQLALDSDVVCWHCGQPLLGREETTEEEVQVSESWQQSVSLSSLGAYLGLTLVVIVAALLVMRSLGQQPLLQVNRGVRPPDGWQRISDTERSFTFWLPKEWYWYDESDPEQKPAFREEVESNPLYQASMSPLGAEVDDVELMFVALKPGIEDEETAGFVVIGRSETLNRLSYEDALTFLNNSQYQVLNAGFVDELEKNHVILEVETQVAGADFDSLRCHQQFIRGEQESILVTACSPSNKFEGLLQEVGIILNSFQRLSGV
jgi:hypothetical protein